MLCLEGSVADRILFPAVSLVKLRQKDVALIRMNDSTCSSWALLLFDGVVGDRMTVGKDGLPLSLDGTFLGYACHHGGCVNQVLPLQHVGGIQFDHHIFAPSLTAVSCGGGVIIYIDTGGASLILMD